MTSNIILVPVLKQFWKIKQSVMVCYPHTVCVFFEQFFLLVGHGGMEFFFIPTDQLQ